jgi:branched-chain amino acid transport system ATP-binding protein
MSTLVTQNLSVRYGPIIAVRDLSIAANTGEIACLVGSNGAGKSSSLRGIMGLETATGHASLDDEPVAAKLTSARVHHGIALVPEGRHVFPYMTMRDNLLSECRGESRTIATNRMDESGETFPDSRNALSSANSDGSAA